MTLESLLAQLDVMVEAPLGVQRVRELLLQLAFRGKLADPVPAEAPERSSNDSVLAIASELASFPIPEGWRWARLSEVAESRLGKMLDAAKNRGIALPYLRNTNVQWFRFALEDVKTMRFDASEIEEYTVQGGDLLLCEGGEPGRGAVWPEGAEPIMFQKALHRVRPLPCLDVHFLLYWIRSCFEAGRLDALYTGATIKHLTGKSLARLPVPVPPLAEQRRIVAKVDELMALCDDSQRRREHGERAATSAAHAVVNSIVTSQGAEELAQAWTRAAENFDLFRTSGDVRALREVIVQLAVAGKLAPQLPEEGTAEPLLFQIAKTTGVALKPLPLRNQPHPVPPSWAWVRLGETMSLVNGRAFKPHEWSEAGVPIIRIQNLNDPQKPFNHCAFDVPAKFHVQDEDLLLSWSGTPGTSFGAFVWRRGRAVLNQHIFRCEIRGGALVNDYAKLAINARLDELIAQAHGGVGLQHVTKGKLDQLAITLPPLAEQRRIVAKVDELMALCDRLGTRIAERERLAAALADAVTNRLSEA